MCCHPSRSHPTRRSTFRALFSSGFPKELALSMRFDRVRGASMKTTEVKAVYSIKKHTKLFFHELLEGNFKVVSLSAEVQQMSLSARRYFKVRRFRYPIGRWHLRPEIPRRPREAHHLFFRREVSCISQTPSQNHMKSYKILQKFKPPPFDVLAYANFVPLISNGPPEHPLSR